MLTWPLVGLDAGAGSAEPGRHTTCQAHTVRAQSGASLKSDSVSLVTGGDGAELAFLSKPALPGRTKPAGTRRLLRPAVVMRAAACRSAAVCHGSLPAGRHGADRALACAVEVKEAGTPPAAVPQGVEIVLDEPPATNVATIRVRARPCLPTPSAAACSTALDGSVQKDCLAPPLRCGMHRVRRRGRLPHSMHSC